MTSAYTGSETISASILRILSRECQIIDTIDPSSHIIIINLAGADELSRQVAVTKQVNRKRYVALLFRYTSNSLTLLGCNSMALVGIAVRRFSTQVAKAPCRRRGGAGRFVGDI
jgi:hypothetical protein